MVNWKEYIKEEKSLLADLVDMKLIVEEEKELTYQQHGKIFQIKLEQKLMDKIKEKGIEVDFAVIEVKSKEEFSILVMKSDVECSISKMRDIEKIIMVDKIHKDMRPSKIESIKKSLTEKEMKMVSVVLQEMLSYLEEEYKELNIPKREEWVNNELLV